MLSSEARSAVGIDLDARLVQPDLEIYPKDVTDMPDKSFDVVACVDVIEHVQEDRSFLDQLVRVARGIERLLFTKVWDIGQPLCRLALPWNLGLSREFHSRQ
jgi:hypothetical protein